MSLEMLCFCTDPAHAGAVVAGGAGALMVDWERGDKGERQDGHDTQISSDSPDDLKRLRAATAAPIICRINGVGRHTPDEVDLALQLGADELLVPMIRSAADAERVIGLVADRARVGVLIETEEAVEAAAEIAAAPVSRIYVGLNDLRIARGRDTIFDPFVDGTLDAIRAAVGEVPFGVGGLTVPGTGRPVPAELLLGEILRLRSDFTFLRRSFWTAGRDNPRAALEAITAAIAEAEQRTPEQVAADRAAFESVVAPLLSAA